MRVKDDGGMWRERVMTARSRWTLWHVQHTAGLLKVEATLKF